MTGQAAGAAGERGGARTRRPRAWRLPVAVLVAVLVAAGFAAFAAVPLGRRFPVLDAPVLYAAAAPGCWFAATVLYAVTAPRVLGHRVWAAVVAAVAGVLLCAAGAVLASLVALLHSGTEETAAVEVAPDGRHALVAERYTAVIDPSCRVYLRERAGPFSRQVVVWNRQDAPCPERMGFAADERILIGEGAVAGRDTGATLTTTFDPERMTVAEELGRG